MPIVIVPGDEDPQNASNGIAAGTSHVLALKTTGTLWGWGLNSNGQTGDGTTTQRTSPVQAGTFTSWRSIAAEPSNSFGVRADGTLWPWGINTTAQLDDGTFNSRSSPAQVGTP